MGGIVFYTAEVAVLLSNTADVGADLAGLGKVIDYKATGPNADDTKVRIGRRHHR